MKNKVKLPTKHCQIDLTENPENNKLSLKLPDDLQTNELKNNSTPKIKFNQNRPILRSSLATNPDSDPEEVDKNKFLVLKKRVFTFVDTLSETKKVPTARERSSTFFENQTKKIPDNNVSCSDERSTSSNKLS